MTGNRGAMPPSSADKPLGSDLARVDSYALTAEDYDEIPELTDEMVARADVYVDGQLVRRGKQASSLDLRVGGTRKAG